MGSFLEDRLCCSPLMVDNLAVGRKTPLCENISLEFKKGIVYALVGENGIGKSTFLRTLSGLIPSLKGEIIIGGKAIESLSVRELAREVVVVLTDRFVNIDLKVIDVISLGRYPYCSRWGKLSKEDWKIVDDVISLVGIDKLRNRTLGSISDGERQKVFIAKAFAQKSPVILLDEPMAFLDLPSKLELSSLLRDIAKKEELVIVYSSHEIEMALTYTDMLLLMSKNGVESGKTKELVSSGAVGRFYADRGLLFDERNLRFSK